MLKKTSSTAGQRYFEDYFQKGALLGQKAAINLWYVDTRPNSQKLFPSIWRSVIFGLQNSKNKLCLVIFFIHIIQLSLFSSEYLPKAGKKLITTEKGDLNYVNKKYN